MLHDGAVNKRTALAARAAAVGAIGLAAAAGPAVSPRRPAAAARPGHRGRGVHHYELGQRQRDRGVRGRQRLAADSGWNWPSWRRRQKGDAGM